MSATSGYMYWLCRRHRGTCSGLCRRHWGTCTSFVEDTEVHDCTGSVGDTEILVLLMSTTPRYMYGLCRRHCDVNLHVLWHLFQLNPNAKETTHSVQSYTCTDWVVSFAFGFIIGYHTDFYYIACHLAEYMWLRRLICQPLITLTCSVKRHKHKVK